MKTKQIILLFLIVQNIALAQDKDTLNHKFNKKLTFGGTFQTAWTTIEGKNLPGTYFSKPSVGGILHVEYHPIKYIGLGVGFGYQQKGAGLKTLDVDKTLGNPDSTNRARFRFHCWDIPFYLSFRSPEIKKSGIRLSARIGGAYSINSYTEYVFHSVEDGFHTIKNLSSDYYKNDLNIIGAIGVDINAGNTAIFQLQFFMQNGTKNVFSNSTLFGNAEGYNRAIGFQIGFFY